MKLKDDPNCFECGSVLREPGPTDLVMFLHALKYTVSNLRTRDWLIYFIFHYCNYRVFIKYCGFFSKVCHLSLASTRLILVVQKNYQPIGVTVRSHCVEIFEGLLQRCRLGRGCSELWKNTIFPEHTVVYICGRPFKSARLSLHI